VIGQQDDTLRILGIDPGLNVTGYGLIDAIRGEAVLLEGGVIRIPPKLPIEQRLSTLFYGIQEIILEFQPALLSLEEVHTQYKRPIVGVMMGHARGVICLAAAVNQIPVFSYAPNRVKSSLTGNGHADKEQVRRMVQNRLKLKTAPEPLDVSDALAIALCHMGRMNLPPELCDLVKHRRGGPVRRSLGEVGSLCPPESSLD